MSTIAKLIRALRKATGNAEAADAFVEALEEREAQREARSERIHQQNLAAIRAESEKNIAAMRNEMQSSIALLRREIKVTNRWLIFIGLSQAILMLAVTFAGLAVTFSNLA